MEEYVRTLDDKQLAVVTRAWERATWWYARRVDDDPKWMYAIDSLYRAREIGWREITRRGIMAT